MNQTMPQAALQIENLSKRLGGRQILTNITFDVYPGEIFGFLGPNGSGKTTTIKLILGLLKIESGDIQICGKRIREEFEAAIANVGGIIENPEMYSYLSGRENLMQYYRMYDNIAESRVEEVARIVGLSNRIDEKISRYSLGMKQRLGVAQAILHNPKVLVLDEPTNGLDPSGIKELREILKYLAHECGVAILVSSHMLAELDMMCDRVGILNQGVLLKTMRIEELRKSGTEETVTYMLEPEENEKTLAILSEMKIESYLYQNKICVTLPKANVQDFLRMLLSRGVNLTSFSPVQRSLEEAFIEVIQQSYRNPYAVNVQPQSFISENRAGGNQA